MISELEKFFGDKFSEDLEYILKESGFENEQSLLGINMEIINDIEKYLNENKSILQNTSFKNVADFSFKPGQKAFLLALPNQIKQMRETKPDLKLLLKLNDFSCIIKTFIQTIETNHGRHPKGFRYNDINRNFATYIYLLCGKACYQTLSANLPIPKAETICKIQLQ